MKETLAQVAQNPRESGVLFKGMKTFVERSTMYYPQLAAVSVESIYASLLTLNEDGISGVKIPDGWEYVGFRKVYKGESWLTPFGVIERGTNYRPPAKAPRIILCYVGCKIDLREIRWISTQYIPEKIENVIWARDVYLTEWLDLGKSIKIIGFRPVERGDKYVAIWDNKIKVSVSGVTCPRLIVE